MLHLSFAIMHFINDVLKLYGKNSIKNPMKNAIHKNVKMLSSDDRWW